MVTNVDPAKKKNSSKIDKRNYTYRKLFSEILRQWNRFWTKRPSKPVEYELTGQNCVARTFTSVVRDMTAAKTDG